MTSIAPHNIRRAAVLIAAPLLTGLLLSGCGSSADGGKDAAAADNAADTANTAPLFDQLPDDVKQTGTIQIGSSIDYPPFEYYEEGDKLAGFEVELSQELEKQLGVTFTWNNASFDTLLPALTTKRYDVIFGAVNDTAEREESFDIVSYLQSSQGFVVQAGNPTGITKVEDLCGKPIAAVRGGVQPQYLEAQSKVCVESGNKAIDVLTFDGNAAEQLAVKQGKAAAMLENYPTAAHFASESEGELEVVEGLQVEKRFFGMVFSKKDSELRDALAKAWQAIIDDGSYTAVLEKWNLASIGIEEATLNPVSSGVNPS
jgi:polar amino acid transport system substrate-binding protein